ncbi:hypothetical protein OU415_22680 [Saccharopolyspora sp. WRP15-2]|uniref:HEAT repeat protein n=1 Tax=Saccharopolyspora oryzae TaxID=2997343 RepID=A0ABT4V2T2_9PSEU|nr:hypothetical protein [Saccharopolyspora oryzae]MDA3628258.1 hypothetical protein [Saccharopolyspora oryzae]
MGTVEALTPNLSQADTAGLLEVDPDELAGYAADAAQPWFRRKLCADALAGRVPETRVPVLLECIRDRSETPRARSALLGILGHREELRAWLYHEDRESDDAYGMPEAILSARGAAGDRTTAHDLATLANDPWAHRRVVGEAGLDALVARYGAEAIIADLGDARPEDRAFRVRMRHRAGEDVTTALADPDAGVAHLAHSLVDDEERLREYFEQAPTVEAKLWSVCALYRLNNDLAEARAIYDSLGRPRVEVDGLDDEVRAAVRREYVPDCEPRTDPRWRLEEICADPVQPADEDELLARARAALTAANLEPGTPRSDEPPGGRTTYNVLDHVGGSVAVSTLGRFVISNEANSAARSALEPAGFRWIDEPLASTTVTGLCTYFFGNRGPLEVRDLLFFWQD